MILLDSQDDIQRWVFKRIQTKKPFRISGKGSRFFDSTSVSSEKNSNEILSLKNLNEKRFFDPDDMVLCVESGMSYRNLNKILAESNMVLPVNPWYKDSCIGSVVASNDFGPNRMNMGGIRDCILGIEYVNGKGEIVKAGGKVVKNVSGYDLTRMLIGSQGGLGVITSITFKVLPKPLDPFGMYGIFKNQEWMSKVKEIHKLRIPIDWIQAVSTNDSNWILGLGYSGNLLARQRIEFEIKRIFSKSLEILSEGDSFPGQKFTPGEKRYDGFLQSFQDSWGFDDSYFHIFATLTTEKTLSFPIDLFLSKKFKILIHPIGGDIHFLHKSTKENEQIQFLEEIKSTLLKSDSKLRWVNGCSKISQKDLGEFGVSNSFSLIKRFKNHLDPMGVFSSFYFDLSFEK